jgi:hypothetical protein
MKVIKPPEAIPDKMDKPSVFLAGSIEMGEAEEWQAMIEGELEDMDIIVLDPRRDDWDPTWEQSKDNPEFRGQVEWELEGLLGADVVAIYFDPNTKSPITLLELGLLSDRPNQDILVCCPDGYWRKGNVDIVCEAFEIEQVETIEQFVDRIRELAVPE